MFEEVEEMLFSFDSEPAAEFSEMNGEQNSIDAYSKFVEQKSSSMRLLVFVLEVFFKDVSA